MIGHNICICQMRWWDGWCFICAIYSMSNWVFAALSLVARQYQTRNIGVWSALQIRIYISNSQRYCALRFKNNFTRTSTALIYLQRRWATGQSIWAFHIPGTTYNICRHAVRVSVDAYLRCAPLRLSHSLAGCERGCEGARRGCTHGEWGMRFEEGRNAEFTCLKGDILEYFWKGSASVRSRK